MTAGRKNKGRATLLDVARKAGVSRATASLVVRKSPLVSARTRARVEAAIQDLGYVYNIGAARLRVDHSRTIGVIVPNLTNPFFAELLAGIEAAVEAAGMVVILANSGELVTRQDVLLTRLLEHGVDGVILCPAAETDASLVRRLREWNLPLVQVLRQISEDCDYAGADYGSGMHQAVDYLVALGHRDIAFAVHGPVHSAFQERVDGFREAMDKHRLQSGKVIEVPMHISSIAESAPLLLHGASRCSAVVCFNDVIALGLSAGLHDLGLQVGRNFSLIGFDDVADAEAMRPRLTSVSSFPGQIGSGAAELLLGRLASPELQPRRFVKATKLQIRQSCGPATHPQQLDT